jgi:methyl-accepting chemotaxis protein
MALTNINTDTLNNATSTGASKLDSAKDAKTKAADDAKKAKQKAIDDAKDAKKKVKDNIKKQKDAIKKQKDEALKKAKDAKKAFDDKVAYLKDQKKSSTKDKKKKLLALITPLLAAFFASQVAIDALISAALKLVKNKLKGKGNVTVTGYAIVFTPTVSGDYMSLKTNFDKRLNSIKTVIKTLKESITLLNNIIRVLLAIITVVRLYIFIKQKILIARLKAASADLAAPTKSKPLTAAQLEKILTSIQNLEDTKKDRKSVV